jgi:hypothetical protein
MNEEPRSFLTWMVNPHHYIAGWAAMAIGLVFVGVAGYVGSLSNTQFPGLLDIFLLPAAPLSAVMAEGFIDWFGFSIVIYAAGLIVSQSRIRISDVLGTQAIARFPGVISVLAILATKPGVDRIMKAPDHFGAPAGDVAAYWIMEAVVVLMECWMVSLMFSAFIVSCNVKKDGKGKWAFVATLILGEILTKTAIHYFLHLS